MIKLRKQILDGNKIMSDLSNQDLQAYFQMGKYGFLETGNQNKQTETNVYR